MRYFVLIKYKMNNVINKFLLIGDKFMPEIHLRQPQFTYSACGPFTNDEERIQKFKETVDTNYVYKNELDKAFLLMMLHILIVKILQKEPLQIKF